MKKIKVGFVGAGGMGFNQLEKLSKRKDVEIAALYEKNSSRGKDVLGKLGLNKNLLVDSFKAVIANPEIDAVWLVSPNSFHGPQSIAAMDAGKHVFCEKPPATKYSDFNKQIDMEAANPELITFVDYILNFDTTENRIEKMIADGEFGDITQIQVNYRYPIDISGDKIWKLDESIMGDAIGMGINHSLSVMVHLMSSQGQPSAVYASSSNPGIRNFEADPIWNIFVKFSNGASGFCFGNIDNSNGIDTYHNVSGTKGGLILDSQLEDKMKVRYWTEDSTQRNWIMPMDADKCKSSGFENLIWKEEESRSGEINIIDSCIDHFINAVKNGKKSPLSFINSRVIAEIGWAARMSASLSKEIKLPLDRDEAESFFESL